MVCAFQDFWRVSVGLSFLLRGFCTWFPAVHSLWPVSGVILSSCSQDVARFPASLFHRPLTRILDLDQTSRCPRGSRQSFGACPRPNACTIAFGSIYSHAFLVHICVYPVESKHFHLFHTPFPPSPPSPPSSWSYPILDEPFVLVISCDLSFFLRLWWIEWARWNPTWTQTSISRRFQRKSWLQRSCLFDFGLGIILNLHFTDDKIILNPNSCQLTHNFAR